MGPIVPSAATGLNTGTPVSGQTLVAAEGCP